MTKMFLAMFVAAFALAACRAHRPAAGYDSLAALGSQRNPVRSGGPFGEREYLRRLQCDDGAAPAFARDGNVGEGADGHILDVYSVICPRGSKASVYMDMYHGGVRERRPVPGFTVLAELPARTAAGCPPQVGPTADSSARYVFNFLEVETPARLLNAPTEPVNVGFVAFVQVGFVVDTLGRVEPGSLEMGRFVKDSARAVAVPVVLGLRFTPAEHRPGCRVRQGMGLNLRFQ